MALWRLYYDLVWTTKNRQYLITPDKESTLYNYIIGKADSLGCIIHGIGGIEDHIHLVASIPPSLSIAEFVKTVKGSSAYYMNHSGLMGQDKFAWQEGYGVFSVGSKQIDRAVAYVNNQKIHHGNKTAISWLEKTDSEDDPPNRWYPPDPPN